MAEKVKVWLIPRVFLRVLFSDDHLRSSFLVRNDPSYLFGTDLSNLWENPVEKQQLPWRSFKPARVSIVYSPRDVAGTKNSISPV